MPSSLLPPEDFGSTSHLIVDAKFIEGSPESFNVTLTTNAGNQALIITIYQYSKSIVIFDDDMVTMKFIQDLD